MSQQSVIVVFDDGPYVVEGLERFSYSEGEQLQANKKTALCRCGASENKPYCDGAHKKIGFSHKIEKSPAGNANEDSIKEIKVLSNGPYEVCGGIGLQTKDEMNLSEDNPYYLCRCGASDNKPFCDGSHKRINFKDDAN